MLSISSTYPSQKAGWLVSQSETLSDFHCVGVSGPLQSVCRPRDVIYFLSLRVCWRNPFQIRGLVVEGGLGKVLLQARHAQVSVRVSSWLSTISNFQFIAMLVCQMVRDAEKQFKSAIKQQPMIGTFLMLGKVNSQSSLSLSSLHWSVRFLHFLVFQWVNWFSSHSRSCFTFDQLVFFSKVYLRLDQPLAALEVRWEKEQNQISFIDTHFLVFLLHVSHVNYIQF